MSCAALVCLLGVYAEGSIDFLKPVEYSQAERALIFKTHGAFLPTDRMLTRNPYGTLALGAEWATRVDRLRLSISVEHQSGIRIDDSGEDSIRLRAKFWLWKRN